MSSLHANHNESNARLIILFQRWFTATVMTGEETRLLMCCCVLAIVVRLII